MGYIGKETQYIDTVVETKFLYCGPIKAFEYLTVDHVGVKLVT